MILPILIIVGSLVAIAIAIARLVKGPFQADRIVALDVVFSSNIALTAAAAVITERELFLDIGVGLSMVGFVATIVWSRLIEASTEHAPTEPASSAPTVAAVRGTDPAAKPPSATASEGGRR